MSHHHRHHHIRMTQSSTGWVSTSKPYRPPGKGAVAFWVGVAFLVAIFASPFLAGLQ